MRKEGKTMAFEDYLEPEVAIAAAVTAAIASPKARKTLRQGAVYGLAGLIAVKDALVSFSHNVGQGMQEAGKAVRHSVAEARSGAGEAMNGASAAHRSSATGSAAHS
jgi:hypothetical protein